jgi:putative serine protease PepD
MINIHGHSLPRRHRRDQPGDEQRGGRHQLGRPRTGSEQQPDGSQYGQPPFHWPDDPYRGEGYASPAAGSPTPVHPKPHKRTRAGALLAAGLAVAVVSAGIGGAVGLAVQPDHSTFSTLASATAAASRPAASVPAGSIEQVAAKVVPSVVQLETDQGSHADEGSGIVLTADGLIMTNAHVVASAVNAGAAGQGGAKTLVTFADGRTAPFSVVATDPTTDIAVVRAQGVSGLTPITMGSSGNLRVGEQVIAVGSPLGLAGTVTSGIVSALDRPVSTAGAPANHGSVLNAIQTDAPLNPGNSGGALVDMNGRLVGMTSAIATLGNTPDAQGGSIGLGFAIPADQARSIADGLIANSNAAMPAPAAAPASPR